jgi:CubicO group peptidase (beta-lactamase class C family)
VFCLGYHRMAQQQLDDEPSLEAFGHSGAGGSTAFADPVHRLSFALVKNRMTVGPGAATDLIHAVYGCLGARRS